MDAAVHIKVEGLVQGVGYRWYAAQRAQSLGVRGYVRNLYDGSVEVDATGDRSSLEELIGHLKVGPRSAHVTNLHIEWKDPAKDITSGFEIR
ncbi:MAG TPA: acylphosphatase [Bacteroidota bacterium]|nr:acylphosphatase [Bacteroidota bacterium]